jgi:hypothetical protein
MSLRYRNKSKSQLTSPTPAQLPALSAGHIVYKPMESILKSNNSQKVQILKVEFFGFFWENILDIFARELTRPWTLWNVVNKRKLLCGNDAI